MSDEMDPEVIADLKLRAYTEHDSSRTRRAVSAIGGGGPEPFVAAWACRNPPCAKPVPVTQTAIDTLAQFNGEPYKFARESRPIKESHVVACPECEHLARDYRAKAMDTRRYELSKAIKLLKEKKNPRDEKDLVELLKKLRHPDVAGLIEAIETRHKLPGNKRASRGDV